MSAIEVKNISKVFKLRASDKIQNIFRKYKNVKPKEIIALKDISFSIAEGEMVGIIGPNGSGKTTLLKLLARTSYPTKGNIQVNGKVVPLLQLGSSFQPELSAIENIKLSGTIFGLTDDEIQEKIPKILKYAELDNFANIPIKHFSAGMFARLAFAISIETDPDIFIFDEVLAVGDLVFQSKCFGSFISLRKNKKTIVYVSHNLSEIETLCDKVLLLHNGEMIGFGNPKEMIQKYKDLVIGTNTEKDKQLISKISNYYKNILGRDPDQAGLYYFLQNIKFEGMNLENIPQILKNSPEYQKMGKN